MVALEANHAAKAQPGEDKAMLLIWELLERFPKVKAELERVKGIIAMNDNQATLAR